MKKPIVTIVFPIYSNIRSIELLEAKIKTGTIKPDELATLEIVVINDNSQTIESILIESLLKKLEKKLSTYYEKFDENKGVGHVRNHAITKARGRYIVFVDDDDELILENLIEKCREEIPEVMLYTRLRWLTKLMRKYLNLIRLLCMVGTVPTVCWNKIYNVDYLLKNDIKFSEKRLFEDELFYLLCIKNISTKVQFTRSEMIKISKRHDSRSRYFKSQYLYVYAAIQGEIMAYLKEDNIMMNLWLFIFMPRSFFSTMKAYARSVYNRRVRNL